VRSPRRTFSLAFVDYPLPSQPCFLASPSNRGRDHAGDSRSSLRYCAKPRMASAGLCHWRSQGPWNKLKLLIGNLVPVPLFRQEPRIRQVVMTMEHSRAKDRCLASWSPFLSFGAMLMSQWTSDGAAGAGGRLSPPQRSSCGCSCGP
jgi:hypothetical protein